MDNWETEFEVKYSFAAPNELNNQKSEIHTLIIEASSKTDAINKIKHRFQYSENLQIDEIKKIWTY